MFPLRHPWGKGNNDGLVFASGHKFIYQLVITARAKRKLHLVPITLAPVEERQFQVTEIDLIAGVQSFTTKITSHIVFSYLI
jgi:hypothetical protein